MFSFFRNASKTLGQIQVLVALAEQVVLAIEQTVQADNSDKKRQALEMLAQLARAHGLNPPQLLLDVAIEAAIRLTK